MQCSQSPGIEMHACGNFLIQMLHALIHKRNCKRNLDYSILFLMILLTKMLTSTLDILQINKLK